MDEKQELLRKLQLLEQEKDMEDPQTQQFSIVSAEYEKENLEKVKIIQDMISKYIFVLEEYGKLKMKFKPDGQLLTAINQALNNYRIRLCMSRGE